MAMPSRSRFRGHWGGPHTLALQDAGHLLQRKLRQPGNSGLAPVTATINPVRADQLGI